MTKREHARAVLQLTSDEQLVAGIGGAVAHFGQRAGLCDTDFGSLATMLEEFCRRALPFLEGEEDTLRVFIEDFEDRIEITVEHRGQVPDSTGSESLPETALHQVGGRAAGVEMICTIDRSETVFDARKGILRTRMVKYIRS